MYVENIVIGKPVVEPQHLFALDEDDWNRIEKEKLIIQKSVSCQEFLWILVFIRLSVRSVGISHSW